MSAYEMIAIGAVVVLGLAVLAFWAAMIYDCATRTPPRSKERYVWLLIVVLGKLPGALAYYLLVKRPAQLEAVSQTGS